MNVNLKSVVPTNRGPIYTLDIRPDDRQFALGQQGDQAGSPHLSLWDLEDLRMTSAIASERNGLTLSTRYAPDSKTLAFINSDLAVCLFDLERQQTTCPDLGNPNAKWIAYARQTNRLAVAGSLTQVWDTDRPRVVWALPGQVASTDRTRVSAIAGLSPDGARAAIAGVVQGEIQIFDVDKGSLQQQLEGAPNEARWISFDPQGRYLAAIEWLSHGTFLWDVRSGESLLPHIFNAQRESFWSLCWHPDGEHLALGMLSGYVLIVRLKDGEYVVDQRAHAGRVWDLAFSSDGKRLISGGDDAIAYVWELS
jgi:WD40 repeat protein